MVKVLKVEVEVVIGNQVYRVRYTPRPGQSGPCSIYFNETELALAKLGISGPGPLPVCETPEELMRGRDFSGQMEHLRAATPEDFSAPSLGNYLGCHDCDCTWWCNRDPLPEPRRIIRPPGKTGAVQERMTSPLTSTVKKATSAKKAAPAKKAAKKSRPKTKKKR